MAATDSLMLVDYIEQLTQSTRKGKITWTRVNPTTFIWETSTPTPARLTIQRTSKNVIDPTAADAKGLFGLAMRTYYVFQATDVKSSLVKVSIEGESDPKSNQKLGDLYEAVLANITKGQIDFLKSVIPKDL